MAKKTRKKVEIAEEGPYRSGSAMFCQMVLIMLPVIGLIYGTIAYRRATDREMKSLCTGMLFARIVGIIFYLIFFVFLLKVCMRIALLY